MRCRDYAVDDSCRHNIVAGQLRPKQVGYGLAFGVAGFGPGAGSGSREVGGDGARPRREAMLLVTALVCAVISAPIVLNSAASRWEIASSLVFVASSFALVSSNFTPKLASMPFTFVASWAERSFISQI